ncbi:hypothetical protein WU87_06455 [Corynebacterium minutissimum]|uniref:Uncharacterized protein n=1 Tax=Corynebacterium minutissimum TaxID=38301 RepID=A0ACC4UAS7_9CORY|nr:hypothetical protein WU87_06455 [Corynebacterium minutissimum]
MRDTAVAVRLKREQEILRIGTLIKGSADTVAHWGNEEQSRVWGAEEAKVLTDKFRARFLILARNTEETVHLGC